MSTPFRHRPTGGKQQNKPFKSKKATKSQIRDRTKSKIERVSNKAVPKTAHESKEARKNKARQLAKQKREQVIQKKRLGRTNEGPPLLVAVIPLSSRVRMDDIVDNILTCAEAHNIEKKPGVPLTFSVAQFKGRISLFPTTRDMIAVLDIAKVADIILWAMTADELCDDTGRTFVAAVKAQGVPTVFGLMQGLDQASPKQATEVKRQASGWLDFEFSDEPRLFPCDQVQDMAQVLRFVCNTKVKTIHWRENRPYLLVEQTQFRSNDNSPDRGTLLVSGYLRGGVLNPNWLVHLTNYGDFQVNMIEGPPDPHRYVKQRKTDHGDVNMTDTTPSTANNGMELATVILGQSDENRESLVNENLLDTMNNEQTWPTEDELDRAEARLRKKVDNSIEAAWIPDSDEEDDEDGEEHDDDEMMDDDDEDDDEPKGFELGNNNNNETRKTVRFDRAAHDDAMVQDDQSEGEEYEDIEPHQAPPQKHKRDDEDFDLNFPDEVDVPLGVNARERFQKYRGLKSFRTSPWDPKENLPLDYSRIFQFQNFRRTCMRVLDNRDGVESGLYITVHLVDVPRNLLDNHSPLRPLLLSGLFKHENKMSVVHYAVSKHPSCESVIKSKDQVIFNTGFRRYAAAPLYSENNINCDKHKYERFLHADRVCTASVYAPISFPPLPVLIFNNGGELLATGSLLSVDPDRLIIKKIVLTGMPYKVHKRRAVVRDMFYNPDDINWFKPVELWTKYGHIGNIKEPLGTHGHMKCYFDSKIGHHDTVCMSLYKRVYPKWSVVPGYERYKPSEPSADQPIN